MGRWEDRSRRGGQEEGATARARVTTRSRRKQGSSLRWRDRTYFRHDDGLWWFVMLLTESGSRVVEQVRLRKEEDWRELIY